MQKEQLIKIIETNKVDIDEREVSIKKESYHWGYRGSYVGLILLLGIRIIAKDTSTEDLMMLLTGQICFTSFYMYKEKRNMKLNLFFAILGLIGFIVFTYKTLVLYGLV